MLKRIVTFLLGHLRIEVTDGRIERFLNLAMEQGIDLWQIERTREWMRASIRIRDFFFLRPVARGARCRVRLLSRHGLPFRLVQLRRRPALMAGAALCLGFVIWASNHVWLVNVKVTGPQNLDWRAVKAVAAEAGLRVGVSKGDVDLERVEHHLRERLGEVSVAVVRLQGTRAVVEVVEKAAERRTDQAACINLVARKQGVVEQVIPFQGEPMVKQGDVVREGDMLVECSLRYWQGGRPMVLPGTEKPLRESVARTLVAQAIIRARITYRQYLEIPLVQEVPVPTGRSASQWVLNWKNAPIILRGKGEIPFARYKEDRKTYSLGPWRNWRLPVELIIRNAEEVEMRQERIPVAQALEQAREQMQAQLRWILGPSDKVLSPLQAEVLDEGRTHVGIRVSVETLEEIGRPREGTSIPMPQTPEAPGTNPTRP